MGKSFMWSILFGKLNAYIWIRFKKYRLIKLTPCFQFFLCENAMCILKEYSVKIWLLEKIF